MVTMELYKKAFPVVAKYVAQKGGSFEEAKDIFQDALVIWYEKKQSGELQLQHTDQAYIAGIARHLWSKQFERNNKYASLDENAGLSVNGSTAYEHASGIAMENDSSPVTGKLLTLLQSSGQKCMDLLRSFYYDKTPLAKIAHSFGFSGTRSATVQKYKCLEKVRETIKEKSLTYEDFLA